MSAAVRFPKFAERLSQACDTHAACPPLHQGRLVWVQLQLRHHGRVASIEAVRKWLAGETRPREETTEVLGRIFGVEPNYLRTGKLAAAANDMSTVTPPLQVAIRPNLVIEIHNIPLNLSMLEATKLSNIILAHAAG